MAEALGVIGKDSPPHKRDDFLAGQDAWTRFRNAECGALTESYGVGFARFDGYTACDVAIDHARSQEIWQSWLRQAAINTLPDPAAP